MDWVRKKIQQRISKLEREFRKQPCPARAWDSFANQLSLAIGEVARMDREHSSNYYEQRRASQRAEVDSRAALQRENQQQRERQGRRAFGNTLQPTIANLKRFYKKHADWKRDQHISRIDASPGHFYSEKMSTAERMASEWNDILGSSHATIDPAKIPERLSQFHEVPARNKLKPEHQKAMTKPITIDEVTEAIDQLPRDKSGGSSRLSHDFYKDFKDELAESLVEVYTDIQNGAAPPESFLDAVIVPLRKKGDSNNAMDYRPISLVNTEYKILGRIYANRIHEFLPRLISSGQQGFVRGRLMTRSITMVQALLSQCVTDPNLDWMDSPAILCLDLRKAYDTLSRDFMAAALNQYGFPQQFLDIFHSLHNGTKASYLVNGEESTKWTINSGIRQGCPLAPLLFVLAVDFLGRAIEAHPQIQGQEIPRSGGLRHVFNGFVDDSTVFLSATRQLEPLNQILKTFGELSGLIVQPNKSVLIPLNTAHDQRQCHGYTVLGNDETTRILGYHVGVNDTTNINWEIRLQNVKKRLQIATQVTNSVKQRVVLFNTIVLPAILFTGQQIPITPEILRHLEKLQKNFIWKGTTAEVQARHRLPPALVFAAEEHGGLGLQNIELALQATRMNQAEYWMQCGPDNYMAAWHSLAHPGQSLAPDCCTFTPTSQDQVKACRRKRNNNTRAPTVQELGRLEVWADQTDRLQLHTAPNTPNRVHQAADNLICYWHHSGALQCALPIPTEGNTTVDSAEFLRAANWYNNSCIVNRYGRPLQTKDYPLIQPCSLLHLQISRVGPGEFLLNPPLAYRPFKLQHYNQIRRWCASIFGSLPDTLWGQKGFKVTPWNIPKLTIQYHWSTTWHHEVAAFGPPGNRVEAFKFQQNTDGWTWSMVDRNGDTCFDKDYETLRYTERVAGLAFRATPFLHATPWQAPPKTLAKNLRKTIRKARSRRIRKQPKYSVQPVIDKMAKAATSHPLAKASQTQSTKQIWLHDGILTDYQRWTMYRICTRTLNLFHAGWPDDRKCSYEECDEHQETIEHILWDCTRAEHVWSRWIPHWLGHYPTDTELKQLMPQIAARKAPPTTPDFRKAAMKTTGEWTEEQDEAMQVLWTIWTTCTQCILWRIRNKEIFDKDHIHREAAAEFAWIAADFQTQAVIQAWLSSAPTRKKGFRLDQCYSVFREEQPQASPTFVQTWTVQIHSVAKSEGARGAWILISPDRQGDTPEIVAVGIHETKSPTVTNELVNSMLLAAMSKIRERAISSTVQVVVQGSTPVRRRPNYQQIFEGTNSHIWETTRVRSLSAVTKLLKLSADGRIPIGTFTFSSLPERLREWLSSKCIRKDSPNWPPDSLNIRQSLENLKESIVRE